MDDPNLDIDSSPSDEDTPGADDSIDPNAGTGDEADPNAGPKKKNAESRINELVAEVKTLKEKVAEDEKKLAPPAPTTTQEQTPEVAKAVEYLKKLGFVQKADVEEQTQAIENRMALDNHHSRLESSYDGEDGRPAYDRKKVEDYMKEHAVYDPEIAYDALHKTELLDWAIKNAQGDGKKKAFVEKPGSSSSTRDDQTITRERIAEAMKTTAGREWYERNRDKILDLTTKGQLQ